MINSVAAEARRKRAGEYKIKNDSSRNEYRLSVHDQGLIALQRFDQVRYGVLVDSGSTLTFILEPVAPDSPVAFQPSTEQRYRVTYRHPSGGRLVGGGWWGEFSSGGSFRAS